MFHSPGITVVPCAEESQKYYSKRYSALSTYFLTWTISSAAHKYISWTGFWKTKLQGQRDNRSAVNPTVIGAENSADIKFVLSKYRR